MRSRPERPDSAHSIVVAERVAGAGGRELVAVLSIRDVWRRTGHPADRSGLARIERLVAAPAPLHADRRNGRTYTAADRRRSGETSTHGGLTIGHLFANPFFHHLDGRDRVVGQRNSVDTFGTEVASHAMCMLDVFLE